MIFMELTEIDYAIAVTVFSFFKSTHTQRSVLKKLAKQVSFMTDELRDRLNGTLKAYLSLAEGRNELLHNPIGRSVEHQVYIMLRSSAPLAGETPYLAKPISPSEIDALSVKIKELVRELYDIDRAIRAARFAATQAKPHR